SRAMSRPMPRPAPVTSMTLPSRHPMNRPPRLARSIAGPARPPARQDLGRRADGRWLDSRWRAREPRSGRRLQHAIQFDEAFPLRQMRMRGRLAQAQHGREARIAAFEDRAPFIAGARLEHRLHLLPQLRPALAIVALAELGIFEPGELAQRLVKLRLQR